MTCVTCHDPHGGRRPVVQVCRSCHVDSHHAVSACVDCHMPKRRTEDVVHAVMTDHFIQRRPPSRDLLAPLTETHDSDGTAYRGEVVPLYPQAPDELYLAVAQVADGSNLAAGIPRLERVIAARRPPQAEFYFELANAYSKINQNERALGAYREALRRRPDFAAAKRSYSLALEKLGRWSEAVKMLEALTDPAALNQLGEAWLHLDRPDRAEAALRQALHADPDLSEAYVNLGASLSRRRDRAGAETAFRSAILQQPNLVAAHTNLAAMLASLPAFSEAEFHFRRAIRANPDSAAAHYNFGRALAGRARLQEADAELRAALRIDPQFADAATSLGLVLARRGQTSAAIEQYRRALQIRPDLSPAHFNLALALRDRGEIAEARHHLEAVLLADPTDFEAHLILGKMLAANGQKQAGLEHLRKAAGSPRADLQAAAEEAMRASGNSP